MAATRLEGIALASKFRGCLIGAVMGDCLGGPFECQDEDVSPVVLQKYFDKLEGPYFQTPQKPYSDDSAMTRCIAYSFVDKGCFDAKDLAVRFVKEFYTNPNRGYGGHVIEVFGKLKAQKYSDIFQPAREQFNGSGSYGNGGAMRVSPVALFCHGNYETLLRTAKSVTEITHAHSLGVHGALLQSIAVHQSLLLNPSAEEPLDVQSFSDNLITKVDSFEHPDEIDGSRPYYDQLMAMKKLLLKNNVSVSEVQEVLGNNVTAIMSVPTAIYSFLRAQKPINGIETNNKFRRTLQYAISLGGDSDTIGSMAGAIAGAYFGEQIINESLKMHCEGAEEMLSLADKLFAIAK